MTTTKTFSTTHHPKVCQYCRQEFDSIRDKGIHATLEHAGEQPLKFAACTACGNRTYLIMDTCDCGRSMDAPEWTKHTAVNR